MRHGNTWKTFSPPEKLEPLSPLPSPQFPQFNELVNPATFVIAEGVAPERKSSSSPGLFYGLLRDDFAALFQDATESPAKYEEQVVNLLGDLVQRTKEVQALTAGERRLLDHATLDFASYVPPKAPPRGEQAVQRPKRAEVHIEITSTPVPGVDVPDTDTPAYWWLQ